jgi:hypothetical protein
MPLDNGSVARETQTNNITISLLSTPSYTPIYMVYHQNTKPAKFNPINATLCRKGKNDKKRIREGKMDFFTRRGRPEKNTKVFDRKHLMF